MAYNNTNAGLVAVHVPNRAFAVLESWELVRGQTQYTRCMSKPEPKSD
jgi:hypothetical protein